jgi:hypothetical protein
MAIDIRTLATANLVVQLVLIALILGAVYLARRGRIKRHCTIVRGAVVVQIIAILIVMLPSLLGYVANVPPIPFLYTARPSSKRHSFITRIQRAKHHNPSFADTALSRVYAYRLGRRTAIDHIQQARCNKGRCLCVYLLTYLEKAMG